MDSGMKAGETPAGFRDPKVMSASRSKKAPIILLSNPPEGAGMTVFISVSPWPWPLPSDWCSLILRLYGGALSSIAQVILRSTGAPAFNTALILYYDFEYRHIPEPLTAAFLGLGMTMLPMRRSLRAGISAIPKGQMEAGLSARHDTGHAVRRVILRRLQDSPAGVTK